MVHQIAKMALFEGFEDKMAKIGVKYVGYRNVYVVSDGLIRIEVDYSELIGLLLSRGKKVGGFGYSRGYEPKVGRRVISEAMKAVNSKLTETDFCILCCWLHRSCLTVSELSKIGPKWHYLRNRKVCDII